MKVALLTDRFSTGGGLEHIYQVTRNLPEISFGIFAKAGDAVHRFNGLANVKIFPEGYRWKYIQPFQPDLIHIHHLKPLLEIYKTPLHRPGVPVIFTMHGAHIHKYEFKKGFRNLLAFQLRHRLEKYLLSRISLVITVSRTDLSFIQKLYHPREIIYIPNGVDKEKFEGINRLSKADLRRKLNLPPDIFMFLTIARYDFAKGHDILLDAISQLDKNSGDREFKFIWVGEGKNYDSISRQIIQKNLNDRIIQYRNFYPVKEIMNACDACILPSRWEGMPLVLLEAGYCKLPVIASDADAHREIITDQVNGRLYQNLNSRELAEVIRQVLDNPAKLDKLANNLYRDVLTKYDLRMSIRKLEQIYRNKGGNQAG